MITEWARAAVPATTRVSTTHVRFRDLDADRAEALFDELIDIAQTSVTIAAAADLDGRRVDLLRDASAYLAKSEGRTVGFVIYRFGVLHDRPAAHLVAACLLPDFQSRGLASSINARIVLRLLASKPFSQAYVVAHIMNPVALEGWRSRIRDHRNFYPPLGDSPAPYPALSAAAAEFAASHDAGHEFDVRTGVVRGRVLSGAACVVRSRDVSVDRHFDSHVDPVRGDTVLMVIHGSQRMVLSQVGELTRALVRTISTKVTVRRPGR